MIMRAKSNENLEAGDCLLEQGMFDASAHCFYYAAFQYMKYTLAHANSPISYPEQDRNTNCGGGSHIYIFNQVKKRIKVKVQGKKLQSNFRTLKRYRKIADYRNQRLTKVQSLENKSVANRLITLLKTHFEKV